MQLELNEVELAYATIRYEKPIVYMIFKEGAELGFPEIRELIFNAQKLSGHKPYFVFSDARASVKVTIEGRKVAADMKEAPLHRASAVLVNNNMFRMAINFFSSFRKPLFPYRAFTNKQKAFDWLLHLPLQSTLAFVTIALIGAY